MANYSVLANIRVLLLGLCVLGVAHAQDAAPATPDNPAVSGAQAGPAIREDAPLQYVVKKGDTLWGISQRFLIDAWQWPEIWYVNGQVKNPHLIYPGDVLSLENINGRRQLVRTTEAQPEPAGEPVEHLSPQIREYPLNAAIPAIPIDAIRDFLSSPRVVTEDQIKHAPYILSFVDEHLIGASGNLAYVRNLSDKGFDHYALVRIGGSYKDPDTGEFLGYEAIPVGTAEVQNFGDPGRVELTATSRDVRTNDLLIPPDNQDYNAFFYPHAPKNNIHGSILALFDGVTQITQYQVVTINRGTRDGLESGHVLTIMQAGRTARDPRTDNVVKLPEEPAGTVMVFKTTPRISYALVMDETRPVHVFDHVVTPRPSTNLP